MKMTLFILLLVATYFGQVCNAQQMDSTKRIRHVGGAANVTNNGISLIPTFSLGKPAAIFNLLIGNNKLSFEPELRFSLEGKPWSFIFWGRYKLVNTNRFKLNVGAHPSFVFKTITILENGISKEIMQTQQFAAIELTPYYLLAKNTGIGMYFLMGHGFQEDAIQNTRFITLNSNFSNIALNKQFLLRFSPQFYYLNMDNADGFFFSETLTLSHKKSPFSFSSFINKRITSNIVASQDFVWNVTLSYSFFHAYLKS